MKSIATSPGDQHKTAGSRGGHFSFENANRVRSGTLGTLGSNSTSTPVNSAHKSISEDSPSSSCVARNTRAISIDLSINNVANDGHRNALTEHIPRTGRKLQAAAIVGEKELPISAIKKSLISCEADKKDKLPYSNSSGNEETDLSSGLPKRLHRLSLSLPSPHSTGEFHLHNAPNQGCGNSPLSDLGSRLFFQNDGMSVVSPSAQSNSLGAVDMKTTHSKTKKIDRSRINSDMTTPTVCKIRQNEEEILPQHHKLMSIDIGNTDSLCSSGGKSPKMGRVALSQVKKDARINNTESPDTCVSTNLSERKESKEKLLSVCTENIIVERNDTEKTCSKNIFDSDLVAKYSTPTKPRCARFVEVEVQKIDYGNGDQSANGDDHMINPFQTCSRISKNDISSFNSDNYNVIVRDTTVAQKNDKILRDKFLEAKSLNRRNETGAVMHNFSLWGGGGKNNCISNSNSNNNSNVGESTQLPGIEVADVKDISSPRSKLIIEKTIVDIIDPKLPGGSFSHGSFSHSKYGIKSPGKTRSPCKHSISKLRGPIAARGE